MIRVEHVCGCHMQIVDWKPAYVLSLDFFPAENTFYYLWKMKRETFLCNFKKGLTGIIVNWLLFKFFLLFICSHIITDSLQNFNVNPY